MAPCRLLKADTYLNVSIVKKQRAKYSGSTLAKFFSFLKLLYGNLFENFILGRVLAHDSYNCGFLNINKTKGFPTQRLEEPSNFVGSNSGKMGSPMLEVCPPPCRPFDHKDWIYC